MKERGINDRNRKRERKKRYDTSATSDASAATNTSQREILPENSPLIFNTDSFCKENISKFRAEAKADRLSSQTKVLNFINRTGTIDISDLIVGDHKYL